MNENAVTLETVTHTHTRVSVSEMIARNSGLFIIPKKET